MQVSEEVLSLRQPDDWHLHLRDGALLRLVAPFSAREMGRAIIMPNLNPPITTPEMALAYKERILKALPPESHFTPLMTLYLTDETTPGLVRAARDAGIVAFKLYPRGATTHSSSGVTDLDRLAPTLAAMEKEDIKLLIHGEVTDVAVDIFDREAVFIERVLMPLRHKFPALKIVLEHITTRVAAEYVESADDTLAATVTPQHLLCNRNQLLVGRLHPHYYCLPILKREEDRIYLGRAVTGKSSRRFFLGTDSAPHPQEAKESASGCAGIFSAPFALELYAEAFSRLKRLDLLEAFAAENGPRFYGLPLNTQRVTLKRVAQTIPAYYGAGKEKVIPFLAGEKLAWTGDY